MSNTLKYKSGQILCVLLLYRKRRIEAAQNFEHKDAVEIEWKVFSWTLAL
jgi:hypothetical protein